MIYDPFHEMRFETGVDKIEYPDLPDDPDFDEPIEADDEDY